MRRPGGPAALAAVEMRQPALARVVPIAVGVVVVIAGALEVLESRPVPASD